MITKEIKEEYDLLVSKLPDVYDAFRKSVYIEMLDRKGKVDGDFVYRGLIEYIKSTPNVTTSDVIRKRIDYYKPWEDEDNLPKKRPK